MPRQDRTSPTPSLLERLFGEQFKSLPPLTPEQQAEMERRALEVQSNWPKWKRNIQDTFDTGWGVLEGLLGVEPNAERKSGRDWANLGTQGVTSLAGLPFAAYKQAKK